MFHSVSCSSTSWQLQPCLVGCSLIAWVLIDSLVAQQSFLSFNIEQNYTWKHVVNVFISSDETVIIATQTGKFLHEHFVHCNYFKKQKYLWVAPSKSQPDMPEQKERLEEMKDTKTIDSRCFHADIVPQEIKRLTWNNDQGYLMIGASNCQLCWLQWLKVKNSVRQTGLIVVG